MMNVMQSQGIRYALIGCVGVFALTKLASLVKRS